MVDIVVLAEFTEQLWYGCGRYHTPEAKAAAVPTVGALLAQLEDKDTEIAALKAQLGASTL